MKARAPGDRREEPCGRRHGRPDAGRLRLDEEGPARHPRPFEEGVVLDPENPDARGRQAGEVRERFVGRDRPAEDLPEDGAAFPGAVEEADRRPVRSRQEGPKPRDLRVLDGERDGERRHAADERGEVRAADDRLGGRPERRRPLARPAEGRRGVVGRAEVDPGRRPAGAGVGHGDAGEPERVGGKERIGLATRLAGEKEGRGDRGGRRRRPGEARLPAASRRRDDPADAGREERERVAPVARAGNEVGPGHGIRAGRPAAPGGRPLPGRIDHPDADDVGMAGGPGEGVGVPAVPGGGDDGDPFGPGAGEDGRRDGILGVAEPGPDPLVREAQVQDLEAELPAPVEGPLDGREHVGGEGRRAAVAGPEDLQRDDGGARRDALRTRGDPGDRGAVTVAVDDVGAVVGEVPPAEDATGPGRGRAEVGMERVDAGVDDPDGAADPREPRGEESVGADLRGADLARGADDPVEDDGSREGVGREPRQAGRCGPAGQDPSAREGADGGEVRGVGSLLARDEDPDASLRDGAFADAGADERARPSGLRRERRRGQGRGQQEGATGAGRSHRYSRNLSPGRGGPCERRHGPGRV